MKNDLATNKNKSASFYTLGCRLNFSESGEILVPLQIPQTPIAEIL